MVAASIGQRIDRIRDRIRLACERSGRDPSAVTLIAVSKTFPVETVLEAHAAGLNDFGENKAQEFAAKHEYVEARRPGEITWHFVGHLQRNKVKLVAGRAHLIHSLDSPRLARSLQDFAEANDAELECLVQVNVSGEESKFGLDPDRLQPFLAEVREFDRLRLKGLMTLASPVEDDARLRREFVTLRRLNEIAGNTIDSMRYLSMGMSADYELAVEEGATHLRVGTSLFGPRPT